MEDPDGAAKIVLGYLAGQPLLTWPAELVDRYAGADPPDLAELAEVYRRLVDAIRIAPLALSEPLCVIVAPLHTILAQFRSAADAARWSGAQRIDVDLNIPTDSRAYAQAILDVRAWLNAHGYEAVGGSDVPDTVPDDWQ